MSLADLSATELLRQLEAGDVTSVEITQACLDRIRERDGQVQAFLRVDGETALAQSADVDRRRKAGQPVGRLAGLPVAVKDLLCMKGELADLRLAHPGELSAALRRHRDRTSCDAADAVLIGKTNMDEFAMGGSTENSAYFTSRETRGTLDRIPGGSQRRRGGLRGGRAWRRCRSAPTPAARSVSRPALCGVTGLKPTYGRVSRYGLVAFASSLDQIGPLGANGGRRGSALGSDRRSRLRWTRPASTCRAPTVHANASISR